MTVLFANTAAERLLSAAGSPLMVKRPNSAAGSTAGQLMIRDRNSAERLRSLVADAARGGSGGAMRLEVDSGADDRLDQLAILITPQPPQYSSHEAFAAFRGPVLILIKELSPSERSARLAAQRSVRAEHRRERGGSGFSGRTDRGKRERDVSLETVRSQIRTVLRKSEAANLRDFERIGALLATLGH